MLTLLSSLEFSEVEGCHSLCVRYACVAYSRVGELPGRFEMEGVLGTSKARVLTLKLWGRKGAWDERRSVLADGLVGLRPGLCSLPT